MEKYINKMFEEYIKSNKLIYSEPYDFLDEDFTAWLLRRVISGDYYARFLLNILKNIKPSLIVELYKGYSDSISLLLKDLENYESYVVSSYSDSIYKYYKKDRATSFSGKLICYNNKPFLWYEDYNDFFFGPNFNSIYDDKKVDTIITQLPLSDVELEPLINLCNSNINILLGTYGYNNDLNKLDNLDKINEIYDRLYNISNVKPIKYYDSNDNMYAKVIKFGDKK